MGYTFCPTDEELLCYYLYHKVVGGFVPPIMLSVVDIYTKEPPQIWQQCGGVDGQDVHFFTCLKKKKSRVVRKVGPNGATWSGESKATKVFSHNNTLVGDFKRFHYENPKMKKGGHHNNNYSWIMYEYTLHPNLVPEGVVHHSFVLFMLRKKILKQDKRAFSAIKQTSSCLDWPNTTKATTTQLEVHIDDLNTKRRRVEEQICIDRVEDDCFINIERFGEQLLNGYNLEEPPQLLPESRAMQMEPWSKDNTLREICPTMETEAPEQNYLTGDEDALLFARELEMSLEQQ
uniref:NAC domain-containing protein n=1 Tax=Cucumis sativus TaxID=3659 RepID=A0A0A0LWA5_CUCSA